MRVLVVAPTLLQVALGRQRLPEPFRWREGDRPSFFYSEKLLTGSPSARAVLAAAPHMQGAYARMPLLFSPSTFKACPPGLEVVLTEGRWIYLLRIFGDFPSEVVE